MTETKETIQGLLQQTRILLEEWNPKHRDCTTMSRERIVFLLQRLQPLQQCSNNILAQIIPDSLLAAQITQLLYLRLIKTLGQDKFSRKYRSEAAKPKETYFFMQNRHSILAREIIENSKAIEAEMDHLAHNLQSIPLNSFLLQHNDITHTSHLNLPILLRLVMQASDLQLQNPTDEMLFRLFILQESITLILHKAVHLLSQMLGKIPGCEVVSGKSQLSSNTKRSALSQSLLIFKMSQQKQGERGELQSQPLQREQKLIRTDYMMQCRPEKKPKKVENQPYCCFGL